MAEQRACRVQESGQSVRGGQRTLYLILSCLHSHHNQEYSSKHATTQHTVNVVMHVPQRPAVDGSYTDIMHTVKWEI